MLTGDALTVEEDLRVIVMEEFQQELAGRGSADRKPPPDPDILPGPAYAGIAALVAKRPLSCLPVLIIKTGLPPGGFCTWCCGIWGRLLHNIFRGVDTFIPRRQNRLVFRRGRSHKTIRAAVDFDNAQQGLIFSRPVM